MVSFGTFVTKAMSQNAFVLVGEKKNKLSNELGSWDRHMDCFSGQILWVRLWDSHLIRRCLVKNVSSCTDVWFTDPSPLTEAPLMMSSLSDCESSSSCMGHTCIAVLRVNNASVTNLKKNYLIDYYLKS